MINKSFEVIFSITCKNETDLDKILQKTINTDGSILYIYCEIAHYEDRDHYVNDRYGVLGSDGKKITAAKYSSIYEFSEGLSIVTNSANQYGVIDTKGNETISPSLSSQPTAFKNGRSLLKTEIGWIYIDKFGRELGRANNNQLNYTYSEGVYKITDDKKYSIFKNKNGTTFLTLPYKTIGNFDKNVIAVYVCASKTFLWLKSTIRFIDLVC